MYVFLRRSFAAYRPEFRHAGLVTSANQRLLDKLRAPCRCGAGVEMRFPGTVRTADAGAQFQGGASGSCETRGSRRAIAGWLGKGLAGKSATQRVTQVAADGFSVAFGCQRAIELTRSWHYNGGGRVSTSEPEYFVRPCQASCKDQGREARQSRPPMAGMVWKFTL